jgi:hypothetical protein
MARIVLRVLEQMNSPSLRCTTLQLPSSRCRREASDGVDRDLLRRRPRTKSHTGT